MLETNNPLNHNKIHQLNLQLKTEIERAGNINKITPPPSCQRQVHKDPTLIIGRAQGIKKQFKNFIQLERLSPNSKRYSSNKAQHYVEILEITASHNHIDQAIISIWL